MQKTTDKTNYFFVDEAGDPVFYDKNGNLIVGNEGCSKILLIGFIKTIDPEPLRKALANLQKVLAADKYLQSIPSFSKSMQYFHAKDDCPEIKEKVFKCIVDLDFKAEFIVARKIKALFVKRHQSNANVFYDDLITKLFQNKLHLAASNKIYYAVRGNRIRQEPITNAIQTAILSFESRWNTKVTSTIDVQAQTLSGEPCLQIVDYINWAVQRAFIRRDMRYFNFVKEKVSYLVDIYDTDKYPKNYYNSRNPFDATKISPL